MPGLIIIGSNPTANILRLACQNIGLDKLTQIQTKHTPLVPAAILPANISRIIVALKSEDHIRDLSIAPNRKSLPGEAMDKRIKSPCLSMAETKAAMMTGKISALPDALFNCFGFASHFGSHCPVFGCFADTDRGPNPGPPWATFSSGSPL